MGVDLLFVVADAKVQTWQKAVKLTLWAIKSDKTFEVISADTFVQLYADMPVEDMDTALKQRAVAMVNSGDISKREWKVFKPLRDKLYAYWQAKLDATPNP